MRSRERERGAVSLTSGLIPDSMSQGGEGGIRPLPAQLREGDTPTVPGKGG